MRWPLCIVLAITFVPGTLSAQASRFTFELPRTVVLIQDYNENGSATRDVAEILTRAGFPISQPDHANELQCRLARAALVGDEDAAYELGRELGAKLLILGRATWDRSLDDSSERVQKRTAEIELRAIRLDGGQTVATARGRGSAADASARAAETRAVRYAVKEILKQSPFMNRIAAQQ